MAYSFAEFVDADISPGWDVGSGGLNAQAQAPICELTARILQRQGVNPEVIESHSAAQVMTEDLERRDLIITASKEERGLIARHRPMLRGRTFTLNEAVALGLAPWTDSEVLAGEIGTTTGRPLSRYATLLHMRRGTLDTPQRAANSRRGSRRNSDPHDIADVHHLGRRHHAVVLKEASESTKLLSSQVADYFAASLRSR